MEAGHPADTTRNENVEPVNTTTADYSGNDWNDTSGMEASDSGGTSTPDQERKTLKIEVTQELIDEGCHSASNCPVAQATIKAFNDWLERPGYGFKAHYSTKGVFVGSVNVLVYASTMEVFAYYYEYLDTGGMKLTISNYRVYLKPLIGDWVSRYDLPDAYKTEPVTFEVPITPELLAVREAALKIYDDPNNANPHAYPSSN